MGGPEVFTCAFEWWWIFPIAMIVLCIFMTRRRSGFMTNCCAPRQSEDVPSINTTDSASQILDKRYALGEISKAEYEEKKMDIEKV